MLMELLIIAVPYRGSAGSLRGYVTSRVVSFSMRHLRACEDYEGSKGLKIMDPFWVSTI